MIQLAAFHKDWYTQTQKAWRFFGLEPDPFTAIERQTMQAEEQLANVNPQNVDPHYSTLDAIPADRAAAYDLLDEFYGYATVALCMVALCAAGLMCTTCPAIVVATAIVKGLWTGSVVGHLACLLDVNRTVRRAARALMSASALAPTRTLRPRCLGMCTTPQYAEPPRTDGEACVWQRWN